MWRPQRQEAVFAAARSVNARLQQKLDRHDVADAKLCREAFSLVFLDRDSPGCDSPATALRDMAQPPERRYPIGAGCFRVSATSPRMWTA